jgi:hypothetical protein
MPLLKLVDKVYPRAQWPTRQAVIGYSAWGGVVAAAALYVVQPWDWIQENLGLKKAEH